MTRILRHIIVLVEEDGAIPTTGIIDFGMVTPGQAHEILEKVRAIRNLDWTVKPL